MLFAELSRYLEKLEQTASRLQMTAQLAELYAQLNPTEVQQVSYLLQGKVVPAYQSLEFQLSDKMLIRSLARLLPAQDQSASLFGDVDTNHQEKLVTAEVRACGDVGTAAEKLLSHILTKSSLTVTEVFERLSAIAQDGGEGSQDRKVAAVAGLFSQLDALCVRYVSRIIIGTLRLGFSTMTILDALSWTRTGGKSEASLLEEAYQRRADVGALAREYLSHTDSVERIQALSQYTGECGVPIVPQLCQRLNSTQEMIEKMHEVYAEPKYDGLRVQIHCQRKNGVELLRVFTRNLEDATHMFPELSALLKIISAEEFVIDGEAIGYDPQTGALRSFQETITRKRKHNVAEASEKVPLKFFIFDVLLLNQRSLLFNSLRERKEILDNLFIDTEQIIKTSFLITKTPEELQKFHEEQLALGLEGMVVKAIDSPYQSGRKGWYWVKMKEVEGSRGKLTDTIDCIVMGYFAGKGQRSSFGAGTFLLGVLGSDEKIYTVSKVGSGLTEQSLTVIKEKCDELQTTQKPLTYEVAKALIPHVWVEPGIVVEVAADELTHSPVHTAGLALRFPRVIKIREDKKPVDATTIEELKQMLELQEHSGQ